jgi:hypothetical protein
MKRSDKKSWDKLIYGLIYPGFLGSMLYELIPTERSDFTLIYFLGTPDNFIRYAIILFYSLDYVHLYGDMDGLIKDPEKKTLTYFIVDIVTCLGYVASFIALNFPNYWLVFFVFGLVPWLFFVYKQGCVSDRKFFKFYGCGTTLVLLYRLLGIKFNGVLLVDDRVFALLFVAANVLVYWYYVGWYFERKSKDSWKRFFANAEEHEHC